MAGRPTIWCSRSPTAGRSTPIDSRSSSKHEARELAFRAYVSMTCVILMPRFLSRRVGIRRSSPNASVHASVAITLDLYSHVSPTLQEQLADGMMEAVMSAPPN